MYVLVATDSTKRGVFAGELVDDRMDTEGIVFLENVRMIVYWSTATKGFLGLAATGPADGSRVGPAVPSLRLTGVICIAACTPAAQARFEEGPWKY